jgi:hypothetical protein
MHSHQMTQVGPIMEGELMRRLTTRIMGTCAAVILGATLAGAQGLDTSRTTIVTFSAPVALPGVTLPAGSYLFRLADSQTNRNIVQVFDKDRTKIIATILAVSAQRNKPADETVITFKESPANAAPAVQYWYYPGETTGQEFAYPKKQAMAIASAAHTSVLAVDTDSDRYDAATAGEVSRVEAGAEVTQSAAAAVQTQPQSPPTETPAPSAQATQPVPNNDVNAAAPPAQPQPPAEMPSAKPQPSQPVADQTPQPSSAASQPVGTSGRLPHTASPLPLIGIAGLLALFGAASVRALRKSAA